MLLNTEYLRLLEVDLKVLRLQEHNGTWSIQRINKCDWEHPDDPYVEWVDLWSGMDPKAAQAHMAKLKSVNEDIVQDGLPDSKDRLKVLQAGLTLIRIVTGRDEKYSIEFCRPSTKLWSILQQGIPDRRELERRLYDLRQVPRTIILPNVTLLNQPLPYEPQTAQPLSQAK
ncbi:MAG TPA: hypothetical protein PLE85_11180 [Bacteroidales bacterium]|nr:hypothetical protein [Bacteroidales bacterium]